MKQPYFLWGILLLYGLITSGYNIINPLFEAPDEHWHYFTVQYIADTGKLPIVEEVYDEWLSQEAAQPPLYYLLGAILIRPFDTTQAKQQVWLNPFAPMGIGNAAALANKNIAVHTPDESFPWQGYVAAVHLLRAFSTLLGAGTLVCLYGCARLLWPTHLKPALLAVSLIAFLPQFNFTHAAVSNDPLIIFLASVVIWQLLYAWLHKTTTLRLLCLGITIGLAALAKTAGILLLLYSVSILMLLAWRDKRYQLIWQTSLFVILPVLLIAGWLWWRNWHLYGDITAANQFVRVAGGDRNYTLPQVLAETDGLWRSIFAVFGWFNVLPPAWVFWAWQVIVFLAFLGAGRSLLAKRVEKSQRQFNQAYSFSLSSLQTWLQARQFIAVLLLFWFLATYGGLLLFMLRTPAAQGRLLFPAIIPLAMGLIYGLKQWPYLSNVTPAIALVTTLYCLFVVIPTAYASLPVVNQLPETAVSLQADMGQDLTLVGVDLHTETIQPGEVAWFTLYWQRQDTLPTQAPEFVLELFGRELTLLGNIHSYHGSGLYPASLWPPNQIVADRVGVRLTTTVTAPVLAPAFVRLADSEPAEEGVFVTGVKVVPLAWPDVTGPALAQIGQRVALTDVSAAPTVAVSDQVIEVNVQWQVLAPLEQHFTTLLHLAEAGQPPLAQGDSPPLNGNYPTQVWQTGEVINDYYQLQIPDGLPNGRYPLWIGLYDTETITRLPLTVDGQRQPHDMFKIGEIEIK